MSLSGDCVSEVCLVKLSCCFQATLTWSISSYKMGLARWTKEFFLHCDPKTISLLPVSGSFPSSPPLEEGEFEDKFLSRAKMSKIMPAAPSWSWAGSASSSYPPRTSSRTAGRRWDRRRSSRRTSTGCFMCLAHYSLLTFAQ